jgi:nitrite reductase (NADH) small subunit
MSAIALPTVEVCRLDDIPVGLGRPFRVGDRHVAVFRSRAGKVFAVDGTCPHKGGPLADGMVVGEQVVCPYHAFRFHGTTGECDQPGTCAITTYPVELDGGSVFVTVPQA